MALPDIRTVRKILVIKLRAVGDVVLSTIVTRNLRLRFPDAVIHYLTEPASHDVVKNNRFLDGTLTYDRKTMNGLDLIRAVRQQNYDMVIDLFCNPRTALVTRLSGARLRVGYRFRGRSYAYTVLAEPRGDTVHNTQFNLDALVALGVDIPDRNIYFAPAPGDQETVDEFMSGAFPPGTFIVCINAGGGWYTKRWGLERYASVADQLIERYRAGILLAWGPGERADVETIAGAMTHPAFIPPPTTLSQLGAVLKRCGMMLTNDSGPMHIAAAVGTPVLGVYGPTNPVLQGPYGDQHLVVRKETLTCLGCNYTSCPIGHPCMLDLGVDDVMAGVATLLARNGLTP